MMVPLVPASVTTRPVCVLPEITLRSRASLIPLPLVPTRVLVAPAEMRTPLLGLTRPAVPAAGDAAAAVAAVGDGGGAGSVRADIVAGHDVVRRAAALNEDARASVAGNDIAFVGVESVVAAVGADAVEGGRGLDDDAVAGVG